MLDIIDSKENSDDTSLGGSCDIYPSVDKFMLDSDSDSNSNSNSNADVLDIIMSTNFSTLSTLDTSTKHDFDEQKRNIISNKGYGELYNFFFFIYKTEGKGSFPSLTVTEQKEFINYILHYVIYDLLSLNEYSFEQNVSFLAAFTNIDTFIFVPDANLDVKSDIGIKGFYKIKDFWKITDKKTFINFLDSNKKLIKELFILEGESINANISIESIILILEIYNKILLHFINNNIELALGYEEYASLRGISITNIEKAILMTDMLSYVLDRLLIKMHYLDLDNKTRDYLYKVISQLQSNFAFAYIEYTRTSHIKEKSGDLILRQIEQNINYLQKSESIKNKISKEVFSNKQELFFSKLSNIMNYYFLLNIRSKELGNNFSIEDDLLYLANIIKYFRDTYEGKCNNIDIEYKDLNLKNFVIFDTYDNNSPVDKMISLIESINSSDPIFRSFLKEFIYHMSIYLEITDDQIERIIHLTILSNLQNSNLTDKSYTNRVLSILYKKNKNGGNNTI